MYNPNKISILPLRANLVGSPVQSLGLVLSNARLISRFSAEEPALLVRTRRPDLTIANP